jgi:hypothetical protein
VNVTAYLCTPCYYTCLTCSNSTGCLSCSSANNRYLNGSQCLPNSGYYDNSVNQSALQCVSPCANCISASSCLSCVGGYYMSGTSCLACLIQYCFNCTSASNCISCQLGYYFDSITNKCEVMICNDVNCGFCPASPAVCVQCFSGFYVINQVCVTRCGDGIRVGI